MTPEALAVMVAAAGLALTCVGIMARAMYQTGRQVARLEGLTDESRETRRSVSRVHDRLDKGMAGLHDDVAEVRDRLGRVEGELHHFNERRDK